MGNIIHGGVGCGIKARAANGTCNPLVGESFEEGNANLIEPLCQQLLGDFARKVSGKRPLN